MEGGQGWGKKGGQGGGADDAGGGKRGSPWAYRDHCEVEPLWRRLQVPVHYKGIMYSITGKARRAGHLRSEITRPELSCEDFTELSTVIHRTLLARHDRWTPLRPWFTKT